MVTSTRPGRALAGRFVAGDTLDDAVEAAHRLNREGLLVSLDLLGEEVGDRDSAILATAEYLASIDRIRAEDLDANISVKPTQLGLAIDVGLAAENIERLAGAAARLGTTVTIDMEDSRYTASTVDLYEEAQARHGNLGIALQAYMRRTPEDLARLIPLGGHIRLCKGAYVEPDEVALTSKGEVDEAFAGQLRTLMASSGAKPAIATHDPDLVDLTRALANERTTPFEFQMLYGVRSDLQRSLVAEGFPVRVYLPFGSEWYPYLTRRLAERPANAWFFARSMFGR
ncbi:MAG TPA: proline dehydrogenase family protein [Acidimicrobiia bacterium]